MDTRRRKRTLCAVLIVLNVAFIWGNSLLPGEFSGLISGWVRDLLANVIPMGGSSGGGHGTVRKLAHFTEFACLGALLAWWFAMRQRSVLWGALGGVLVACADETIQRFIPGRGPSLRDVCIDTAGMVFGLVLLCAFVKKHRRKINEKMDRDALDRST